MTSRQQQPHHPTASAARGASWSAVAEMPEPSGIGDTAVERPTATAAPLREIPAGSFGSNIHLAACLALVAFTFSSCGKNEAPIAIEAVKPAPVVSEAKIDAAINEALSTPQTSPEAEKADSLLQKAEGVLNRHASKNAEELLNVPEVHESLKICLQKLAQDKALQNQINTSVQLAAQMKGLSAEAGSVGLDLNVKGYDAARKSRMLQAVLSEDPRQIVRFLSEEIGEATPELSFGGVERASNGVSIKETPLPPK
ncbi:MAG: hypothetical protein IPK32_24460 [Verrucomicrobiaceae bacterium]|nr:hypothetical protein [Verrucomicrobiaceae bacterium]